MTQKYFLYAFLLQFIVIIQSAEGMKRTPSPKPGEMAFSDQGCPTRARVTPTRSRSISFSNDTSEKRPRSKSVDRLREEPLENIVGEAYFPSHPLAGSPPSKLRGLHLSRIEDLDLKNNTLLRKRWHNLLQKLEAAEDAFQQDCALFQDDVAIEAGLCGDWFIRPEYYETLKGQNKYEKLLSTRENLARLQSKFDNFQKRFRGIH